VSSATKQKITAELARMRLWRRVGDEREAELSNDRINSLLDGTFAGTTRVRGLPGNPTEFAAAVVPGGRVAEFIRLDPDVRRIVEHFFAEDKPFGTLCHGPQVPAALGHLRGRRSSGFPALAPDIEQAGGEYVEGAAVVDGNMVSCRGWGDLAEWSRAFLDVLDRAAVTV